MRSLSVVIWAVLSVVFQTAEPSGKPPFGVCEVLQNVKKFNGKVIEIRGEWAGSYALVGECSVSLKTGDKTWANGIAIATPESVNRDINTLSDTSERPDWNLDNDALDLAYDAAARLLSSNGPNTKVFATFVGRVDFTPELLGKAGPPSAPTISGFGHLNAFPARLVLINIRGVGLSMQDKR
jgi:hypothetical protein